MDYGKNDKIKTMEQGLERKAWWNYLEEDLQELLKEALLLIEIFDPSTRSARSGQVFHDYSFVVFPAAKAYEGFLKKFFFDLKFINEEDYYGKHFRIGKALNPSLPKEIRHEGVYDKLVNYCGGKDLADNLWETWKMARNLAFHWFPNEKNAITLPEARERVKMVIEAIDMAFRECKLKNVK